MPVDPTERQAWIALASVEGIGIQLFGQLVGRFGGARATLEAAAAGRLESPARGWRLRQDVRRGLAAAAADPARLLTPIEDLGLWTLTPWDPAWPMRLRGIPDSPVVLHGWGDPAALAAPQAVAVVGTRRPSAVGRLFATRLADRLAEVGVVVVSGLAIGIDGAAHAAVTGRGGRTVAVVGAGHRTPGPRAHRTLLRAIIEARGAVVSEMAPSAQATRGSFPRRNRILSGLADATLVVEAPARSGAINTAHHALEQGRTLLVAPGRPGDERTAGCLGLLRETEARPLIGIEEALVDLGLDPLGPIALDPARRTDAEGRPAGLDTLGEVERAVARLIGRGPADLDELVEVMGLPAAVVASAIGLLQLRGLVQSVGPAYLPAGALLARKA